jgi:hypothetical protein
MTPCASAWALDFAVFEWARERGLRGYRVRSRVLGSGVTIISLVLPLGPGEPAALAKNRQPPRF